MVDSANTREINPSADSVRGGFRTSSNDDFGEDSHASFLAECARLGISTNLAEMAAQQSRVTKTKWWAGIQNRPDETRLDGALNGGATNKEDSDEAMLSKHRLLQSKGSSGARSHQGKDAAVDAAGATNPAPQQQFRNLLRLAKAEVLTSLCNSRGDTANPRFLSALRALSYTYHGSGFNLCNPNDRVQLEGTWDTISRPIYDECIGTNSHGDPMYTLGRMSIQKVVSKTRLMDAKEEVVPREIPRSLRKEMSELERDQEQTVLRTYDIEVHFTVEPKSLEDNQQWEFEEEEETYRAPSEPLKATMTSFGYLLPDPGNPIRFTVWFTGGVISPIPTNGQTPVAAADHRLQGQKFSAPVPRSEIGSNTGDSTLKEEEVCSLPLHECRRKRRRCPLHGLNRPTRSRREAFVQKELRYMRPKFGRGSEAGQTNPYLRGPSLLHRPFSSEWEDIFSPEDNWRRTLGEKAKALAAKLLLGAEVPDRMEDDGTMAYTLTRPIGGHGFSFVDVLYLDEDMRILKGNAGAIFVQVRLIQGLSSASTQHQVMNCAKIPNANQDSIRHRSSRTKPTHTRKAMAA